MKKKKRLRKVSSTSLLQILHKDEAVGLKIAKLLVEHGAQVDDLICDLHETSALWFAVKYKKFRLARFFVEECNANVNVASVSTMMPVLLLAINTDIEVWEAERREKYHRFSFLVLRSFC